MADDNVNLSMVPANITNFTSTTSSVAPYSDTALIIQYHIFFIIIFAATANIILHMFIKELQTVSGVLIVSLCTSFIIHNIILVVHYSLMGQEKGNANACALLFYIEIIFYFAYDTSKLCILIQFTYLMYHSYKTSEHLQSKRSILCKYATLIVLLSVVCSLSLAIVDIFVSRHAFQTTHGRCTLLIDSGTTSSILFFAQLIAFNVFELGFMITGLVLYFLTTRRCCSSVIRDVKIIIVLNCTVGINTTIAIILFFIRFRVDVILICATTSSAMEQVMLFLLFFTSTKVLNNLDTCHHTCARNHGNPEQ